MRKTLLLPTAMLLFGSSLNSADSDGRYVSASLYADYANSAYGLYFDSGLQDWYDARRYYGLAVRPVYSSSSSVQY